jgi:hypothetical protein
MQADRVVEALQRFAFMPDEEIEKRWDYPDSVKLSTNWDFYEAEPADWQVGSADWVDEAVRVFVPRSMHNFSLTHGLVLARDGEVLYLNQAETMKRLGSRVDPLAYAELLGELYSGHDIARAVVKPFSATESFRSGWLVRDVNAFTEQYPAVDPSLVAAPQVRHDRDTVVLTFFSYRYYLLEFGAALDTYRWLVTVPAGRPAEWSRDTVAERVEV